MTIHERRRPYTRSEPARYANFSIAIGYLRAALIVFVVAIHVVLAYRSFAPVQTQFGPRSALWNAFPIVDGRRWAGFDPLVGFADSCGMSLMFFLSGLFVWNSLQRKGITRFMRARAIRLGLPVAAAIIVLAAVACYPAYLVAADDLSLKSFLRQ